ncbi:hypothetical protein BDF14DRAFT_1727530, partial [Spinellus fusiger]
LMSLKDDPRRPNKVTAFHHPPKNEEESDFNSSIAMFVAMTGIFLRNQFKLFPWVATYFGLSSFLNQRTSLKSKDGMANSGFLVALVSLLTFYLNMYMMNRKALSSSMTAEDMS